MKTLSMPILKQQQNVHLPNIVPWETLVVKKKWENVKTAFLCNKRSPTYSNAKKLKETQNELMNTKKSQYIQGLINKIRNSVEDR